MNLLIPALFKEGYSLQAFPLDPVFATFVKNEQWNELDAEFKKLVSPGGAFFKFLAQFHDFKSIEFIISLRDSNNEWEEDGIWHDDGTRVFAFSLSLTRAPEKLEGGALEMRRKGDEQFEILTSIPTPAYGTAILFLTGVHGYEHRTRKVIQGRRVMLAGWCLK